MIVNKGNCHHKQHSQRQLKQCFDVATGSAGFNGTASSGGSCCVFYARSEPGVLSGAMTSADVVGLWISTYWSLLHLDSCIPSFG